VGQSIKNRMNRRGRVPGEEKKNTERSFIKCSGLFCQRRCSEERIARPKSKLEGESRGEERPESGRIGVARHRIFKEIRIEGRGNETSHGNH